MVRLGLGISAGSARPSRLKTSAMLGLLIAVSLATSSRGQAPPRTAAEVYPETSYQADSLLRSAAVHARDGQWAEAVEIYNRVIDNYGDKVVELREGEPDRDSRLYVDVRSYCQRQIAGLPPEGRAVYRSRADGRAEAWYRQGSANRDRSLLLRVVEEAFCSAWGDDALELLGDLAFQDGRFAEALSAYRQIVPDPAASPGALVHPDPSVSLAKVAAKALLGRAALADDPPGPDDLQAYATAYPEAEGPIAGRRGPIVRSVSDALADDHLAPPFAADLLWPTFAGSPRRSRVARGQVDVGSFQWRVELDPQASIPHRLNLSRFARSFNPTTSPEPPLAYHPIVVGDQVIVADEHRVVAYDLNERAGGTPMAWKHEPDPQPTRSAARQYVGTPRFTLTAFGDRIYARLGTPGAISGPRAPQAPGAIVALDRAADGKLLWRRTAGEIDLSRRGPQGAAAGFEGSPVADDRAVYVAMTEGGVQHTTYVVCLDAQTGETRWTRYILAVTPPDNGANNLAAELSHRLLTIDGSTLYYQTNLGAVASLDAATGRLRWLATYPSQDRETIGSDRDYDLKPAVVHGRRVIVAPEDSPKVYAFDSATGRLAWKTEESLEIAHLLGVARGRVVATGNYVWTLDVETGAILSRWPDTQSSFEGYGRGLLSGDQIYWPTKGAILILDQATGFPSDRQPIRLQELFGSPGGNLAVGDGYLIVAQPDALIAFCQNSRLIERYRNEIARSPDRAEPYFRLARVAEAVGEDAIALASLDSALSRVRPGDDVDGRSLADAAREQQYRLLLKMAGAAVDAGRWAEAIAHLEHAAREGRSDRDRLAALFRLADAQARGGEPRAAVATYQGLLADPRLRALSLVADAHLTVRADLLIADRLAALVRDSGRLVYEGFDRKAEVLLERGRRDRDVRLLEEVGRMYPVARSAPAALRELGRVWLARDRPSDAAHAFKRLLAQADDDDHRAEALWGLAQAYEAQQHWVPARAAYAQALERFADVPIDWEGGAETLGALVADRLARPPYDRFSAGRSGAEMELPLSRRWSRRWPGIARPLAASGVPPSSRAGRVFLAERTTLSPIDPRDGQATWSVVLDDEPVWLGYLSDRLIVGTNRALLALQPESGAIAWRSELRGEAPGPSGPNPFRKDPAATEAADGPLDGFRIEGGRIFCRRGEGELLALDGDTGQVEWTFAPPSSRLNPHLWIGPRRIVLQVRETDAILVLETASGRRLAEHRPGGEEDWAEDPILLDDDHVALVADRRTVGLFDLRRGEFSWTFRESATLPQNGPPRLLGDAERLVVLHDGRALIRLDPRTGARLWARPLGTTDLSGRPDSLAMDGERIYWVGGHDPASPASAVQLEAIRLADGKVDWRRFLTGPESRWALTLTDRCVAAYPIPSGIAGDDLADLPLIFCRRESGRPVQRLLFQSRGPDLAVRLGPRVALIATATAVWGLADRLDVDTAAAP